MSNENVHPIFKGILDSFSETAPAVTPFEKLAEKHFDIWVNNNEESFENEHARVSIQFAKEAIENIILAASGPADLLNQIQIKVNELKQYLSDGKDKS